MKKKNSIKSYFENNIKDFKELCKYAKILIDYTDKQHQQHEHIIKFTNPNYYCKISLMSEDMISLSVRYKNTNLFTIIISVDGGTLNFKNDLRIYDIDYDNRLYGTYDRYTKWFYEHFSPEEEFNQIVFSFFNSLFKKFKFRLNLYKEQKAYEEKELRKQADIKLQRRKKSYRELINELNN